MKRHAAVGLFLLLLAGCGEPTVASRLDGLRGQEGSFVHNTLPSPERKSVFLDAEALAVEQEHSVGAALRRTEEGRAVLEAGATVVPELVALLQDPGRRTLAAVFLAEIGGQSAAAALLTAWRDLRDQRTQVHHYARVDEETWVSQGYAYEGVDGRYFAELIYALAYAGLPASAEIAADTRAAIGESGRRQAAGEDLSHESETPEARRAWSEGVVSTAQEGLRILAMIGAPEAQAVFEDALASPVAGIRWEAVQNAYWIGEGAQTLVPAIAAHLGEPRLQEEALIAIREILDLPASERRPSGPALAHAIADLRHELQRRGLLPR